MSDYYGRSGWLDSLEDFLDVGRNIYGRLEYQLTVDDMSPWVSVYIRRVEPFVHGEPFKWKCTVWKATGNVYDVIYTGLVEPYDEAAPDDPINNVEEFFRAFKSD